MHGCHLWYILAKGHPFDHRAELHYQSVCMYMHAHACSLPHACLLYPNCPFFPWLQVSSDHEVRYAMYLSYRALAVSGGFLLVSWLASPYPELPKLPCTCTFAKLPWEPAGDSTLITCASCLTPRIAGECSI